MRLERLVLIDVGQQTQLLQQRDTQALGFIDNYHDAPVSLMFLSQEFREGVIGRYGITICLPEGRSNRSSDGCVPTLYGEERNGIG